MKRVFIIQNTPLNEPLPLSVYLTGIAKELIKNKEYDIKFIVAKTNNLPDFLDKNQIISLNTSQYSIKDNIIFPFKVFRILKKESKNKKIDILHCFYPNSSLVAAYWFKKLNKNIKIIYDVRSPWIEMTIERGFIPKKISKIFKKLMYIQEKLLCKKVDSFIFVTKGLLDYYKKKLKLSKKQKLYHSPSGVDLNQFKKVKSDVRSVFNILESDVLIGTIGGITSERKPEEILYLFEPIIKKNSKVKLMLVGGRDNNLDILRGLAKKLNIEKNVYFTGNVAHKEIPKYISSFDFGLCHLTDTFIHRNNFSLKILEYLACEVPVIASNVKSNIEISKQLPNITIINNSKEIEKAISKKNKIKRPNELIEYSWKNLAEKYFVMYGETK
jgi:glycosyltransferase involved in cell wall biosynthesis